MINYWLEQTPTDAQRDLGQSGHFILDGTFLHRPRSLIVLMDAESKTALAGRYPVSESSEPQLVAFLEPLTRRGLRPRSFTVDGNPQVIKVLRRLWPDVAVQRCLIHIQRQGLMWCRSHPKSVYAKKLRDIFLQVTEVRTKADCDRFIGSVWEWERRYGHQLATRPEAGWVFSDIKRARSMLLRALPDMFHYLDDPLISRSTNGLEGYFSRLKSRYRQHRGLTMAKRENYFRWYLHLVPK